MNYKSNYNGGKVLKFYNINFKLFYFNYLNVNLILSSFTLLSIFIHKIGTRHWSTTCNKTDDLPVKGGITGEEVENKKTNFIGSFKVGDVNHSRHG